MHPTDGNTYAINSMMEEREDYDLKREMELEIQDLRDEVDVLIAKLAEVESMKGLLRSLILATPLDDPRDEVGALSAKLATARDDALEEARLAIRRLSDNARAICRQSAHLKRQSLEWSAIVSHLDLAEDAIRALPTPAELMARIAKEPKP